jgi:hypothetical protein
MISYLTYRPALKIEFQAKIFIMTFYGYRPGVVYGLTYLLVRLVAHVTEYC